MGKKRPARSLEDLSHVFLSTRDQTVERKVADEIPADASVAGCSQLPDEIEETVTVRRRIAYHDNAGVDDNMRNVLSEHLRQGYRLRRIELQRREDTGEPKHRVRREEDVTIFVKGGGAPP
ncbi:MAG: hypothetical protein P8175_16300 [Deltaproteobacteria bacterium]|jgi:hypothetical protein